MGSQEKITCYQAITPVYNKYSINSTKGRTSGENMIVYWTLFGFMALLGFGLMIMSLWLPQGKLSKPVFSPPLFLLAMFCFLAAILIHASIHRQHRVEYLVQHGYPKDVAQCKVNPAIYQQSCKNAIDQLFKVQ